MRPIPLPVRVAAGLVVTALERARKVPEQLAELPVTAASRAVQAGMRVQQQVTKLAIKGDEVFAMFRPVHETPPWARFDEDDSSADQARTQPSSDQPRRQAPSAFEPGTNGFGEVDEAQVAQKMTTNHRTEADRTRQPPAQHSPARQPAARQPPGDVRPEQAKDEPTALPGYDELSLAQLRGKLRALSLEELETLLEYEHAHRDRAPFVTMLSNRISTIRSQ